MRCVEQLPHDDASRAASPPPLPFEHGARGDHHDAAGWCESDRARICRSRGSRARESPRAAPCARRSRGRAVLPLTRSSALDSTMSPLRSTIISALTCSCLSAYGVMFARTNCAVRRLHVAVGIFPVAPIGRRQRERVERQIERILDPLHGYLRIVALELGETRHEDLALNADVDADQGREQQREQRNDLHPDIHSLFVSESVSF